jgi:hypothetical protein
METLLSLNLENYYKSKINYVLLQRYNQIQEQLNLLKNFISENEIKKTSFNKTRKFSNTRRGRFKKYQKKKKIQIHSKMSFDNILRKIKVMYHGFIIKFVNDYIKFLYDGFQRFRLRKISGEITQNVTKKHNKILSEEPLKEFLSNKISSKYKQEKNKNKKIVEKLCSLKSEIKELFEMPYIIFYQKIFLCTNRTFLENKYGISKRTLTFDDNLQILNQTETVTYYKEVEKIGKKKFLEFLGYNINSKIEIELKDYNFIDNYKLSQKKYPLFEVKKD